MLSVAELTAHTKVSKTETDMESAAFAIPQGGGISFTKPESAKMPCASNYRLHETGEDFSPRCPDAIER